MQEAPVQYLVREILIRFHMQCSAAKKKKSAKQHQCLNVALEALGTGVSGILGTSINALIIHGEHC